MWDYYSENAKVILARKVIEYCMLHFIVEYIYDKYE